MLSKDAAPGPQQRRFAAYLDSSARAAHHVGRREPLKNDCRGLLPPLQRNAALFGRHERVAKGVAVGAEAVVVDVYVDGIGVGDWMPDGLAGSSPALFEC